MMMREPKGANSSVREEINIFNLANLPLPERDFSLDVLLEQVDGSDVRSKVSFETAAWCRAEDQKRADAIKAYSRHKWPDCSEADLIYMDELLEDFATNDILDLSRASATCMRHLRLRFLGAILKFVASNSDLPAAWITLSHPDWWFGCDDPYWDEFQFETPRVFRSILRIGGVMTAPGFLIAYLYAQFDPTEKRYQLQFRGICGGEKLGQFVQLSKSLADPINGPLIRDYIWLYPSTD